MLGRCTAREGCPLNQERPFMIIEINGCQIHSSMSNTSQS